MKFEIEKMFLLKNAQSVQNDRAISTKNSQSFFPPRGRQITFKKWLIDFPNFLLFTHL